MFKELGSLANLAGLMKNAQALTGKMQEARDRLGDRRITGTAGGGMVSVEMNGHSQVLACQIDPALFARRRSRMIEDLVVAATNQAFEKVKQVAAEEMGQVAEGLDLPGLSDAISRLGLGGFPNS